MRRTTYLIGLPILAAVLWAGCAPVEPPPSDKKPPEEQPAPAPRNEPPPPMTNRLLEQRIKAALTNVHQRDLRTDNGFWTVLHGILGMGFQTTLRDPFSSERKNAMDYICSGGEIRGLAFIPTKYGLDVRTGPVFVGQGHQDQFIAEMAQWGMPADRKFIVLGKEYTFRDFIRHCQMRASLTESQELSWAAVIIAEYIGTDVSWTNEKGEKLHFADLIRYELNQPVDEAACGGTHRLFGLTWALHRHLQKGGKKEGVWKDTADKLERYKQLAHKYQNPDGSFSTKYLAGPENVPDVTRRINTTGHVLEWLALAMTDSELKETWVQNAAFACAMMVLENGDKEIDGGSLYHASHGLHVYYNRMFGPLPGRQSPVIPLLPAETVLPAPLAKGGN
jgi:hypothetical protein